MRSTMSMFRRHSFLSRNLHFGTTNTVVLLFLRYRPKRTRLDLFGMHFPSISSTCIDFRKCYKNQWILNDFAPADHPDRSRRPFLAKSKIALPLRKYPHFRSSTGDFHHDLGCPLRGVVHAAAFGAESQIGPESVPFDTPIGSVGGQTRSRRRRIAEC